VITSRDPQGRPFGVTANSFNSVSMDPPLILWSLARTARCLPDFEAADHFCVHILREDQAELSRQFSRSSIDRFEGVETETGTGGVPILTSSAARLECETYGQHDGGDHVIFLGRVLRIMADHSARPLLYHGGRYAVLSDTVSD
jgi:3-hydroxy-9,10-secoandrosta-1,3,5(10)-triene-9,17-dione monooxygenase reductase component